MPDRLYQHIKVIAKNKGMKASPEHDLYKMMPPYFINAFYYDFPRKKNSGKITIGYDYGVKYSYFDDLSLTILNPVSDIKLTDKIRANSGIAVRSFIDKERIEYDFDGRDESYRQLAEDVFAHIEKWYMNFKEDVKEKYGDLEKFFVLNKDKYPRQAALVNIHLGNYAEAEDCLKRMPRKSHSTRLIQPETEEQVERLINSGAEKFGKDSFLRDDMDCYYDYIIAQRNGVEWTAERARLGLSKAESGERAGKEENHDTANALWI